MLLKPKTLFNDTYTVAFPIKKGAYAETYRVKDSDGNRLFLKLFDTSLMTADQLDAEEQIKEIQMLELIDHPNLPQFRGKGTVCIEGKSYQYVLTDFISSETLAERLIRAGTMSVYEVKEVGKGVLEALKYLHSLPEPVVHNEVTALNVLVNLQVENRLAVRLIDFGHARKADEAFEQSIDGLDWFYLPPERFDGASTPQSDLYAVGALMYQLLFGLLPWFCDLSNVAPEKRKQYLLKQKHTQLLMPNMQLFEMDGHFLNVLRKALAADVDERFQTAEEFIQAINGTIAVIPPTQSPATFEDRRDAFSARNGKQGNGFADVAGMDELKAMLSKTVLNILKDTERAKAYKLKIPNGMLLYGPPGCGKSFFAEKFAEEAGYNFKMVKASDLASIYVHGSQEKIGKLFEEARQKAPTILCFDEFDALVPARGKLGNEHQSGEVNEFLTQLNNCGETNVFVIASTNRPDMIDTAVLRRGRIDKIVYVPMPDEKARAAIFEILVQGRPCDSGIDYDHLAQITKNYIASDIDYVVNEAASRAAFNDEKISQATIEEVITENKPSLSPETINSYAKMREKMEGFFEERRRIGF